MDYIIDMIASSTIYASSSNTKKIQCTLKGDYLVYKGTDGTSFIDKTNNELDINVDINEIQNVKVDSW